MKDTQKNLSPDTIWGGNPNSSSASSSSQVAIAWLLILIVTIALSLLISNRTHYFVEKNFDEWAYAMPGVEWAETGHFSTDLIYPRGFFEKGNYYMAHPQLSSYLEAISIWGLGFSRFSIRMPSLLLYILTAALVFFTWRKLGGAWLQGIVVAGLFFGSPFTVLSATTARPEMLSTCLVFLACAIVAGSARKNLVGTSLAGFMAGLATYNHPTFFGPACLPFLLMLKRDNVRFTEFKALLRLTACYAFAAAIALLLVAVVLIVPHVSEWREQFLGAVSTPYFHSKEELSVLGSFLSLKQRFSFFGYEYLAWYLLIVVSWTLLFRFNAYFIAGIAWTTFWMFVVHLQTQLVVSYCTQFAVGAVVVVFLAGSPRFDLKTQRVAMATLTAVVLGSVVHWILVTKVHRGTLPLASVEKKALKELARFPEKTVVTGDAYLSSLVALSGRIYYYPGVVPYGDQQNAHYQRLLKQQARAKINRDGSVVALEPTNE